MSTLAIDYNLLTKRICNWFSENPALASSHVRREPDPFEDINEEHGSCIDVLLERHDEPQEIQRITGGRSLHVLVTFSIWVTTFSVETRLEAVEARNDIIAFIQTLLLIDREMGGLCESNHQDGGDMIDARREGGWASSGQIRLIVKVRGTY